MSLRGFPQKYHLQDAIRYIDYPTKDIQRSLTPAQVLQILEDGHQRFRSGHQLHRDLARQVKVSALHGQHPLAVVLGCMRTS